MVCESVFCSIVFRFSNISSMSSLLLFLKIWVLGLSWIRRIINCRACRVLWLPVKIR